MPNAVSFDSNLDRLEFKVKYCASSIGGGGTNSNLDRLEFKGITHGEVFHDLAIRI